MLQQVIHRVVTVLQRVKANTDLGRVHARVSNSNLVLNDVDIYQSSVLSCDSRVLATGWSYIQRFRPHDSFLPAFRNLQRPRRDVHVGKHGLLMSYESYSWISIVKQGHFVIGEDFSSAPCSRIPQIYDLPLKWETKLQTEVKQQPVGTLPSLENIRQLFNTWSFQVA
jgi:hypothetical protein